MQRVRRQRRPAELKRGHAGVRGARGARPVGHGVQRPGAGRVGAGLHAVRVRIRPAAVHRGHRAGRARADPHATGALAGAAGRVAAAGAPAAPDAGQGPGGPDHVAGHQAARLGDAVRRRAAAGRAGQLLPSAGRGQRRGDDERRQVRAPAQHAHTHQGHAQEPLVPGEQHALNSSPPPPSPWRRPLPSPPREASPFWDSFVETYGVVGRGLFRATPKTVRSFLPKPPPMVLVLQGGCCSDGETLRFEMSFPMSFLFEIRSPRSKTSVYCFQTTTAIVNFEKHRDRFLFFQTVFNV